MVRFIKPGDLFMFKLLGFPGYGIGRIIAKNPMGHVAEIFDTVLQSPEFAGDVDDYQRLIHPCVLDSYSLFDKKTAGDWRIIGRQDGFEPNDMEDIHFVGGAAGSFWVVDYLGENARRIPDSEQDAYPRYAPLRDVNIQALYKQEQLDSVMQIYKRYVHR